MKPLVFLILAASASAEVIIQDDFESGRISQEWTWSNMEVVTDRVHSGRYAARGVYRANEDQVMLQLGMLHETHPDLKNVWVKYSILYGALPGNEDRPLPLICSKLMRIYHWRTDWWYYAVCHYFPERDDGRIQCRFASKHNINAGPNIYLDYPMPYHAWRTYEHHLDIEGGVLEVFVNGDRVWNETGFDPRGGCTTPIENIWVGGNYSDHRISGGGPIPNAPLYVWIDDVTFSTERIQTPTETPAWTPTVTPVASAPASTPPVAPTPGLRPQVSTSNLGPYTVLRLWWPETAYRIMNTQIDPDGHVTIWFQKP